MSPSWHSRRPAALFLPVFSTGRSSARSTSIRATGSSLSRPSPSAASAPPLSTPANSSNRRFYAARRRLAIHNHPSGETNPPTESARRRPSSPRSGIQQPRPGLRRGERLALALRNLVRRHFKPILEAAGLPATFRLYDLRHSCATLLLAAGENPKIVAERLGHASVTMTLDTYSHVLPDMQRAATEKLEAMLFAGTQ